MMSTASPRIIVALDYADPQPALALAARLDPARCALKVGKELFVAGGPQTVRTLVDCGFRVFLDLKFHDIPNTVAGAVRSAVATGASMLTVHASGGTAMLRAAVDAAGGCRVMGVTVLTSFSAAGLGEAWGRSIGEIGGEVTRLASLCQGAGTHGLVCSGHELAAVRAAAPGLRPLVPGIRFAEGDSHDQARVMTPESAAAAGASYLVIGRMVTGSPDPVAAMRRVTSALE